MITKHLSRSQREAIAVKDAYNKSLNEMRNKIHLQDAIIISLINKMSDNIDIPVQTIKIDPDEIEEIIKSGKYVDINVDKNKTPFTYTLSIKEEQVIGYG